MWYQVTPTFTFRCLQGSQARGILRRGSFLTMPSSAGLLGDDDFMIDDTAHSICVLVLHSTFGFSGEKRNK
jgi:hypothetical protein